jgi:hypothetical protein
MTQTKSKAQELRDMADVLDSLPDLPNLYIVFNTFGGANIQVSNQLDMTDAERIAVVDRLAAAFGVECAMRTPDVYGTSFFSQPDIYAPGIGS